MQNSGGTLLEHLLFSLFLLLPAVIGLFSRGSLDSVNLWLGCVALHIELCVKEMIRVEWGAVKQRVWCVARSQIHGEVYVMTGAHFIADI